MQMKQPIADAGDYLKAFACTAVMLQTVLSFALTTRGGQQIQTGIGWTYLAIKFTAPAFICGILFSTIRQSDQERLTYRQYLRRQWSALGVPTVWWTFAYLLVFPQLQQHQAFTTVGQFMGQFVNGNAAPHLWYNTMMLQIIVLMPLWWLIRGWLTTARRCWWVSGTTILFTIGWLVFYWQQGFLNRERWYWLDRVCWGFALYAILGILLAVLRPRLRYRRHLGWLLILLTGIVGWLQGQTLFVTHAAVDLVRSSYYAPATVGYALGVIGAVVSLAIYRQDRGSCWLPVIHWVATYAYRAYLANVFWLEIIWLAGGRAFTAAHPVIGILMCYGLTWLWSFACAFGLHRGWQWMKGRVLKWQNEIGHNPLS